MSYTRTDWVSGETPLSAENMNNIEDGIEECQDSISDLNSNLVVKSTPLTVNTQGATGSGMVYKYGRICVLTATIRPTTTGIELSLAWIPNTYAASWKPIGNVWLSCDFYASNITSTAEAKMQASDGVLRVSTPAKDVDLKISGAWISVS